MFNIKLPAKKKQRLEANTLSLKRGEDGLSTNEIKILIYGLVRTFITLAIVDISNVIFKYLKFSLINHLIYCNSKIK